LDIEKKKAQQVTEDKVKITPDEVKITLDEEVVTPDHVNVPVITLEEVKVTPNQVKPKITTQNKPRPGYGIQSQNQHKDEVSISPPSRPLLSIMNPFGSLPPLQWSSFTALIHRLFHDQQTNLRLLKEQQDEEDKCRHITDKGEDKPVILPLCDHTSAMIDRCTQLCTRHGFVGGRCLPNYNEKSGCVCLLDDGGGFGK
jgi:hypothetical protein